MIRLDGQTLVVETATLTAEINQGFITSLRPRDGGAEWVRPVRADADSALQLVYASGQVVGFESARHATITPRLLSDHLAEVRFHGWDGDGVIVFGECPESGALLVEPSTYSSRPGVLACRWNLCGIADDAELVAPLYQGVKLRLDDELIRDSRWPWPFQWEAGLAILQGKAGGLWVHTQDTDYRYKALKVGTGEQPNGLGFDTEAYGPADRSLAAGGLTWRINVYQGDWQVPAGEYRKWLWRAHDLQARQGRRKGWVSDIALAVGWCRGDVELLDALAEKVDPKKTLIHFSNWRTDAYDENYPSYVASAQARSFIARGAEMGFHILPHCNSIDMDPTHPAYAYLRDFRYREVVGKGLLGWGHERGEGVLSVPNSNVSLLENRQRKVMVKIHPGLAMWRSILAENIQKGLAELPLDAVFIDVTLCTYNLHNCLVENLTSTQGMKRLIDHVAELDTGASGGTGLAVGGEGLNEITMQGLSFGQVHLFRSSGPSCKGLERTGGCALNALLFDGLARSFGYSRLGGRSEDDVLRSDIHVSLGAIPTLTRVSARDIRQPTPYVKQLLELAAHQAG